MTAKGRGGSGTRVVGIEGVVGGRQSDGATTTATSHSGTDRTATTQSAGAISPQPIASVEQTIGQVPKQFNEVNFDRHVRLLRWGNCPVYFRRSKTDSLSQLASLYCTVCTVQSFSNAVHHLWRSYGHKVAHIFRAEDDDREPRSPLIVPQRPVDRVSCHPPLDKNGSDKNAERLYSLHQCCPPPVTYDQ